MGEHVCCHSWAQGNQRQLAAVCSWDDGWRFTCSTVFNVCVADALQFGLLDVACFDGLKGALHIRRPVGPLVTAVAVGEVKGCPFMMLLSCVRDYVLCPGNGTA